MSHILNRLLSEPALRRAVSVPTVAATAATLSSTVGVWAPVVAVGDLAAGRKELPRVRSLATILCWTSLESAGLIAATGAAMMGRGDDAALHFTLQREWSRALIGALRLTAGLRFQVQGLESMRARGPVVVCARHASLIDVFVPVWLCNEVGLNPRIMMAEELQMDPCLDVVGNRLPHAFVARGRGASDLISEQVAQMTSGADERDACVIFPEGRVMAENVRLSAMEEAVTRAPARRSHVSPLKVLGPARARGTELLLRALPDADLALVMHSGFPGFDSFGSSTLSLPLRRPVEVSVRRFCRGEIDMAHFEPWLDEQWLAADRSLSVARD